MSERIRPSAVPAPDERAPNPEQQAVIDELDQNIILYASAGTGKTFTVAKRVGSIIASGRALPGEILCLTFTIKAAAEMREDVCRYAGGDAEDVTVRTIHSFCSQVIREESKLNNDLYCDPFICDETDEAEELKNLLLALGLKESAPVFHNPSMLPVFMSALKHTREEKDLYSGDEEADLKRAYETIRDTDKKQFDRITFFFDPAAHRELRDDAFMRLMDASAGRLGRMYNDLLRQSNLLDFDDLICMVHRMMKNAEIRTRWQQRFKYIIIDEMQDTSALEYDTLSPMFGSANIMMCGDRFQTIYEWRGSDPEQVLDRFTRDHHAVPFMFFRNYRSTRLLTLATFGYLKNTYPGLVGRFCPPEIVTEAGEEGAPILNVRAESLGDEACRIWDFLSTHMPEDPTRVCIMARTNGYITSICRELVRVNRERGGSLRFFTVDNDSKFFRKAVIKDIMAFINVMLNRTDMVSLARIVRKYVRGVGRAAIDTLTAGGPIGLSLSSFMDSGAYDRSDPYQRLTEAFENSSVVVYDTETTGLDLAKDQIIQLSAIRLDREGRVTATFDRRIIPTVPISRGAAATHHQTLEDILAMGGTPARPALADFCEFVRGAVLVGHNSLRFDSPLVRRQIRECGLKEMEVAAEYDTLIMAKQFLPFLPDYKLSTLCAHYHFVNEDAHNALGDIAATGRVLTALLKENVIPTAPQRREMTAKYASRFENLYRFIASLAERAAAGETAALFQSIIDRCRLRARYPEVTNQAAMDDLVSAMENTAPESSEAFLRELASGAALSGSQMDLLIRRLRKIPIITVHQSKGCEFDLVILCGADDSNFPTFPAVKNGMEEEEKRVFYVAITRAKKQLILTSVTTRVTRSGLWPVEQSRFIAGIPQQYVKTVGAQDPRN